MHDRESTWEEVLGAALCVVFHVCERRADALTIVDSKSRK